VPDFVSTFLNWHVLITVWPLLAEGVGTTLALATLSLPIAICGGLLLAVLHGLESRPLRSLLIVYIDLLRAIPPLVLLIFIFYGLPFVGIELGPITAATLALAMNGSSFFAEIFRAGLEGVPRGLREAARSTGLTWWQTMASVVIPIGVKAILPDLVSNTIELFKETSIASAVALQELLRSAEIAQGITYNPTPLIAAAIIYLATLWPFVRLVSRIQKCSLPIS
jgi:polar amino acid transport system permease protein